MINFKYKTLNIEGTPRCTLECSMCKRTTYFDLHKTKVIPGRDLTPDDLKKILKFFEGPIVFGGQLSDPIFNKHFIELLEICREHNTRTFVLTAATGRKEGWYENAFLANPNAEWTFGIDGLPYISHTYRKNQNGEFLFKMMLLARSMGIKTVWQYIIFRYNEKYVRVCKQLAIKYGITLNLILSQREMPDDMQPIGKYE